ncbi:MAG TPA: hypothetical protein VIS95_07540 [Solirubrobacterales bacterium]
MENETRPPWLLIAIAALSLVLGAMALVVAFDAKDSSEDSASEGSVRTVDAKLTSLIDRLGIEEESLGGEQQTLKGEAKKAQRRARSTAAGLSKRLEKAEGQIAALQKSEQGSNSLDKRVKALEAQAEAVDSRLTALNQRVTKLSRRVNSGASSSGGETAP